MIDFNALDFSTPLIDFIKSCPFFDNSVEFKVFDFDNVDDNGRSPGNMIMYNGTGQVDIKSDVIGNHLLTLRCSVMLFVRRASLDEISRASTYNFLSKFELWVAYQNAIKNFPVFGDGITTTLIVANNGSPWQETEEQQIMDYMIQLNYEYEVELGIEEE